MKITIISRSVPAPRPTPTDPRNITDLKDIRGRGIKVGCQVAYQTSRNGIKVGIVSKVVEEPRTTLFVNVSVKLPKDNTNFDLGYRHTSVVKVRIRSEFNNKMVCLY